VSRDGQRVIYNTSYRHISSQLQQLQLSVQLRARTISAGLNDRTEARQLVLLATPDDYIANIVSTLYCT